MKGDGLWNPSRRNVAENQVWGVRRKALHTGGTLAVEVGVFMAIRGWRMIKPEDLRDLRTASPDYAVTEALKAALRKLREERDPFFLRFQELDRVFHWKLRGQYRRQSALRAKTPDSVYCAITEAVFKVTGPDLEFESVVRLEACSLPCEEWVFLLPRRFWLSRSRALLRDRLSRVARNVR